MSEESCYICYETESDGKKFAPDPCGCKGSIKIHSECLYILCQYQDICGVCHMRLNKPKKFRDGLEVVERIINNRKILFIINLEGKKDGLYQEWYINGQLRFQVNCVNGKREGLLQAWYESGKLRLQVNYIHGKEEGLSQTWHENGQLMDQVNYVNGKLEGLCKVWYKCGNLREQCNYVNGKEEGLFQSWHENGEIYAQYNYLHGEKEGLQQTWHENGQLWKQTNYVDGKEMWCHIWDENGVETTPFMWRIKNGLKSLFGM